jgi:hypothetical protein
MASSTGLFDPFDPKEDRQNDKSSTSTTPEDPHLEGVKHSSYEEAVELKEELYRPPEDDSEQDELLLINWKPFRYSKSDSM